MSSLAYYLISLGAALLAIAIVSGLITRHVGRRLQAVALLDAPGRSTDWMAAQGPAMRFQQATRASDPALDEIRSGERE